MNNVVDVSFLSNYFDQTDQAASVSTEVKQEIQDGYHVVDVLHVKLTESKKNNNPQLMWVLQIADGEYQDHVLYKYNTITQSTESVNQLKCDLHLCGAELTNPSQLNDTGFLSKVIDSRLQVLVQSNGYGKNTYVQRRIQH